MGRIIKTYVLDVISLGWPLNIRDPRYISSCTGVWLVLREEIWVKDVNLGITA